MCLKCILVIRSKYDSLMGGGFYRWLVHENREQASSPLAFNLQLVLHVLLIVHVLILTHAEVFHLSLVRVRSVPHPSTRQKWNNCDEKIRRVSRWACTVKSSTVFSTMQERAWAVSDYSFHFFVLCIVFVLSYILPVHQRSTRTWYVWCIRDSSEL